MKRIVAFCVAVVLTMTMFAGCSENRFQTVEAARKGEELESTDMSEQSSVEVIGVVSLTAKDIIPLEPDWTNLDEALAIHENNPCIDESCDSFPIAKLYRNVDGEEVSVSVYLDLGLLKRREKGEEEVRYFDTLKLPYEHEVIAYVPTTKSPENRTGKRDETSFSVVLIRNTDEIVCVRASKEIGKHTILKDELAINTVIQSIYLLGDTAQYMYPYIVHSETDGTFFEIWTEEGAKRWANDDGKESVDFHGIYSGYFTGIYDVEREKFIPAFRTELWKTFAIETNDKTEKTICMTIASYNAEWSWNVDLPYIEDDDRLEKIELDASQMEEFIIFPRKDKIKCIARNSGKYEMVFTIENETAAKNLEHLLEEKQFMQENIQDFDKLSGYLKSIEVKEAYVFSSYEEMLDFMSNLFK